MNVYGGVIQELIMQVCTSQGAGDSLDGARRRCHDLRMLGRSSDKRSGNCLADLNLVYSMAVAFIMMQLNGG